MSQWSEQLKSIEEKNDMFLHFKCINHFLFWLLAMPGLCRNLCHPVKSAGSSCSTAHTWLCTYRWIFSVHILSSTFGLKSNETSLSWKIMAQPISVSCNWGRISSSLQCQDLTVTWQNHHWGSHRKTHFSTVFYRFDSYECMKRAGLKH